MTDQRRRVGEAGEDIAARHLQRQRYKILQRNLRLGRAGEIDIVAEKAGITVLCEVKSRLAGDKLGGMGNITATKQAKLILLGELYIQKHGPPKKGIRFDAIEVEFDDASCITHRVKHLEDAFRA